MAVRSSTDHHNEPKIFFTQGAANFFRDVLKLDPQEVSLRFEAWVLNKLHTWGILRHLSTIVLMLIHVTIVPIDADTTSMPKLTKAISICPPAYYADIVCERARVHRPHFFDLKDDASTFSGAGGSTRAPQHLIHENLINTMYYI